MPTLRVALAQFDFPVGAVTRNAERIKALAAEARDRHQADLIVFPELALSGYPPEDLLLRPSFLAECEAALLRLAAEIEGIVAIVGWPQSAGSIVYNAASVLRDGGVEKTYRKRELPNYAVFDERRYFEVDPDGGSCVFEVAGVKVGIVICEDLWFGRDAGSEHRYAGRQDPVHALCDTVMVMQHGRIVEAGPAKQLYAAPKETYTRELISAAPDLAAALARRTGAEKPPRRGK